MIGQERNGKTLRALWSLLAGVSLALCSLGAQAAFMGRDASNAPDATCTVSGATKCPSFYNDTLDITILNDWNIS